jgi:biopolymer transport protein ExbB
MTNPFVRREPPWFAMAVCVGLMLFVSLFVVASNPTIGQVGPRSLFWHMVYSAGSFFGTIFVVLTAWMAGEIIWLSWQLRPEATQPSAVASALKKAVAEGDAATDLQFLLTHDPSLLSRVMRAGLGRMENGIDGLEGARDAALQEVFRFRAQLEGRIGSLTTIGTLAPLFGVMGTVFGLILTLLKISAVP